MLSKKKKIIILVTMAILLVVTGYLNVVLNNNSSTTTVNNETANLSFFASYRNDRENTRNSEIAYYDAIISSENSSLEAKNLAETKKAELIQKMETELVVEGLIKAKGFEDVIVTNSNSSVNVVIKTGELTTSQVAQIASIVTEQTGASIDCVKITPVS